MKKYIKNFLSKISIDNYEKLLSYSILRGKYSNLTGVKIFCDRETLWDYSVKSFLQKDAPLVYLEFGVHKGYSINHFAKNNTNKNSIFIGLDSFEGLPEDWGLCKKGAFDTQGQFPSSNDGRVSYIKGWFQDSWGILEKKLTGINLDNLVVHYDADLYSSTLFALSKIDLFKRSYIGIFDEFMGHETRALYNYSQAFNARVEFLGQTLGQTRESIIGYPQQVVVLITPNLL